VNVHVPIRITTYPPYHVPNTIDPYGCCDLSALLFDEWTVLRWTSTCNLEKKRMTCEYDRLVKTAMFLRENVQ